MSTTIYSVSEKLDSIFNLERSNIPDKNFIVPEGESQQTWGGITGQSNWWLKDIPSWNTGISPDEDTRKKISDTMKRMGINWTSTGATEAARKYHLGRKQSEDHVMKRTSKRCRKVEVDGVVYNSLKEASEALNVNKSAISGRLKRGKSARYL